ncbi:MAG: PEP-utilizing enzyme, partial [Oscillospiraceae bacterium]|nr:PEP-utilizing enzyme [Oscillospiraceae bacterium]
GGSSSGGYSGSESSGGGGSGDCGGGAVISSSAARAGARDSSSNSAAGARDSSSNSSTCGRNSRSRIGGAIGASSAGARGRSSSAAGGVILKGVPCSGETITGTARVIKDIHDSHRLHDGDILVTKCTDPAWTAVFSKIGGVITETGGMLSHAAVISREYGISCILVVKNATDVIKDGDTITMDCRTGEILKAEG